MLFNIQTLLHLINLRRKDTYSYSFFLHSLSNFPAWSLIIHALNYLLIEIQASNKLIFDHFRTRQLLTGEYVCYCVRQEIERRQEVDFCRFRKCVPEILLLRISPQIVESALQRAVHDCGAGCPLSCAFEYRVSRIENE